jgi:3-keto-5-aminohexanoate cleavage enzyme
MKARLRLRMSSHDAHYGGGLVDGARVLGLFGDVATELLVRLDGDEGLFRAYEQVEFLAPVYGGDTLEVEGEVIGVGASSRKMRFEARKVIASRADFADSAAEVLAEPIVVARAVGTCVTPKDKQRLAPSGVRAPVILTAAIVGAETTRQQTPYLPLSAEEIGEEARRCREAGVAVIHLHAREPDGTPTQSRERFREFIEAIRARTDVIVQTSTGGAIGMPIAERCQPLELGPEMATLNVATMNFGDDVFMNTKHEVEQVAGWIRERAIIPEIEIYDAGHLDAARALVAKGMVVAPLHFQFVLGVPGGLAATPRALEYLIGEIRHGFPDGSTWAVAAVGRHQLAMAELAIRWGGHARIGLEDNIYLEKGVLAKGSAELAERAAGFARAIGRPIATPAEARKILGIVSGSAA